MTSENPQRSEMPRASFGIKAASSTCPARIYGRTWPLRGGRDCARACCVELRPWAM